MKKLIKVLVVLAMIIAIVWLGFEKWNNYREIKDLKEIEKQYNEMAGISPSETPTPSASPSPSATPRAEEESTEEGCKSCEELERDLEIANQRIETLNNALDMANKLIESSRSEGEETNKNDEKDEVVPDNSEEIQNLRDQLDYANARIEELKAENTRLSQNSGKDDSSEVEKLNKDLDAAKKEIETLKKEKKSAEDEREAMRISWNEAEIQRIEAEGKLEEANNENLRLNNLINEVNNKLQNLEISNIENSAYMELKFKIDGNYYKLAKETTLYADASCTVKIPNYYDLRFLSNEIDKGTADNGLGVYCLLLANGDVCYVPQNLGKPKLVTEEEFWELHDAKPEKFEWLVWENWQY